MSQNPSVPNTSAQNATAQNGSAHNTVRNTMLCDSARETCTHSAPGHALRPLQARVSVSTPSKWSDAIVREVTSDGWAAAERIESGETVWIWHHADLSAHLSIGEPVALHGLYNTLAVGDRLFSVLVARIDF